MTSSRLARRCGAPWIFLGVLVSTPALAQRTASDIESARQLYNQGIELRDKGDIKNALEKFRAAHALGNTPITGIELCKTYAVLAQPVEAREVCLGVARIPPLPQETPRSQEARDLAGKIAEEQKPKIGSLRLKIVGVPPGREPTVIVDGAAIPPAALREPRALNPGVHVVTAKVGSGAETRATLETREGEQKDLELAVQAPADEAQDPPFVAVAAPAEKKKKSSPLATASFVVAGIAAGVGAIAGLGAIARESDLEKECGVEKQCGVDHHDDLDAARTWATVSTVSFILAGAALGAGIVAVITNKSADPPSRPPPKNATLTFGPGGIRGAF